MKDSISFKDINFLPPIIEEYLKKENSLHELYKYPSSLSLIEHVIKNKKPVDRIKLVHELSKQNARATNETKANISLLADNNTFSVTTGHQLCLFTGPLYFIYKILSTVKLCMELKSAYPTYNFVPVYWMATEDHDVEEINHFYLFNKKITWESKQKGSVGRFTLTELQPVFDLLRSQFREENIVIENMISCYEDAPNLAEATRNLVDYLFGKYGVVTIDGDNTTFKHLFSPIIKDELINQSCERLISRTNEKLSLLGYKTQVNPRELNLFYLKDNSRERIVLKDNTYHVLNTSISFSKEAILNELEQFSERFSPNVALRPVYQELLLPNVATIGGPGETAYWLQLKSTFEYHNVSYPMLILRNSALVIRKSILKKIDKLELNEHDLFLKTNELVNKVIKERNPISFEEEISALESIFSLAKEKATTVDFSLEKTVIGELKKAQNSINLIQSKTLKAEKRNNETLVNQLTSIKENLFPNGGIQERTDNILNFYTDDLFDKLLNQFNTFEDNLYLIKQ